jgi:hypothetical protein
MIEIKRETEEGFSFIVKVEVRTFEHAYAPLYGIETIIMGVAPFGVRAINYEHKGDEWEQKMEKFKNEPENIQS